MAMMVRGAPLLSALLLLVPVSTAAQQSPASGLGDPSTGRATTMARPAPPDAELAVPQPPEERERARRPPPAGYDGRSEALELDEINRLRALDATFATLSASGGVDIGRAVMSLIGGGLEIGIGALVLEFGDSRLEPMAYYYFVLGSTTIVRSVLVEFILRPDPRGPAIEYMNMPQVPRSAALERLEHGEELLRSLAERAWIARMVDGGLSIAGALAVIPAYLVPKGFEFADPLEAFFLLGPAFGLINGIITLATTTTLEQRWAAYDRMRKELRERQGDRERAELSPAPISAPSLAFDVSLDPHGGGMGFIHGRF